MQLQHKVVDQAPNILAATAVGSGMTNFVAQFNVYLEFATLIIGLVAGVFALLLQYRRWREDKRD